MRGARCEVRGAKSLGSEQVASAQLKNINKDVHAQPSEPILFPKLRIHFADLEGKNPVCHLQSSVYGIRSKSHVPRDWSSNLLVNFI